MRYYTFQKALIRNTDIVFRPITLVCFTLIGNICYSCRKLPVIVFAWCWNHQVLSTSTATYEKLASEAVSLVGTFLHDISSIKRRVERQGGRAEEEEE